MNITFITAGPIEWASSRLRAFWVADALRERGHEVTVAPYAQRRDAPIGEAIIWQKMVDIEMAAEIDGVHGRQFWDVCDPSWWWQPEECREIAGFMERVVASSAGLAEDYDRWALSQTATCIPDCLNLSHYTTQRVHDETNPIRLIWYGIAANRIALWGAKAMLERAAANHYPIELTIMDDRPDVRFPFTDAVPIYHTLWSLDKEVEIISNHDIALLPPYPGPWGRVKSNNKQMTAVACGLPVVADNFETLAVYVEDFPSRKDWADANLRIVRITNDISIAAEMWENVLK